MESTAQSMSSQPMGAEAGYWRGELESRRERLLAATQTGVSESSLRELLSSVDAALARLDAGTFGLCERCRGAIEADRLFADPLVRFCLDDLSSEEQRALERDLALAADIQRALLPPADWSIDGWQARYHYQPAKIVSGDYCDLIAANGGFLFLFGDVAGKGVAASMLMSHLHATFRSLAGQHLALGSLIGHANRLFCESTTAGQYATMIVGAAQSDGTVEYVSAGHLPLFHIASDGIRCGAATGVPLGMFSSTEYAICRLQLAPGDRLFLYTDGLTEAFNSAGAEFGVERLQLLAKRHSADHPQALLTACLDEMQSFSSGKPADDLTMLVLHRSH